MPLFLVIHEIDGAERVFIGEGPAAVFANLAASMAGFEGTTVGVHAFEPKQARKIGKTMIGRMLSQQEAAALLKRIGYDLFALR